MNKKKSVIIAIVGMFVVVISLGISFAVFNYSITGLNSKLVAGDIYMHYKESNSLNLSNALPSNTYNPNNYFEFTVGGKNTYTKKDIIYDIVLGYGDEHETRTIRIKDELLKFRLVEVINNEEQEIFTDRSYTNLNDARIYKATIPASTNSEITHRYRLYAWISNDTVIGVGDNVDYSQTDWNNVYASVKVTVTGNFEDKIVPKPLYDIVKTNAVDDSNIDGNGTPIHFYEINGDSNGNGNFVRHNTLSDTYPIYYYRGNVQNNNVLFANKCWQIVRTTETGGTKMIYNGEKSVNLKALSQTDYSNLTKSGNWTFDSSDNSWNISMTSNVSYNFPYEISFNVPAGNGYILQILGTSTTTGTVSGVVFKGGLQVNQFGGSRGSLIGLVNTFETLTSDASDLIKITYYVVDGNVTNENPSTLKIKISQPDATLGYGCDRYDNSSFITTSVWDGSDLGSVGYNSGYKYGTTPYYFKNNISWTRGAKFGSSYTWDGTSYTLVDGTETTPNATHHYSCNLVDATASCSNLMYVDYISENRRNFVYLKNGKGIEDVLKEMLSESTDTEKSLIHQTINIWYNTNIKNSYGKNVEDTAWCNDRSVSSDNLGGWNPNGGSLSNKIEFDVFKRYQDPTGINGIQTTNNPVLTCSNPNDIMSVANGKLENPVALLTYDEANLAGLIYGSGNNSNYLLAGYYWLLSPADSSSTSCRIGCVSDSLDTVYASGFYPGAPLPGVRPALSIKHEILVYDGDGTVSNPYIVGTPRT